MISKKSDANGGPIYRQLRDDLAEQIGAGRLRAGERLPSERELAAMSGAARMTVREALRMLEGEGLIYREDRRGYFVCPPRLRYDPTKDVNTMRLIPSQGRQAGDLYLGRHVTKASGSLARAMSCREGTQVVLERAISLLDGRKVCYEEMYLLKSRFPGYERTAYQSPLTDFLVERFGVRTKQIGFRARPTNLFGAVVESLEVRNGTPGIFVTRIKENEGRVVQVDREYWLSDVLEIVVGKAP